MKRLEHRPEVRARSVPAVAPRPEWVPSGIDLFDVDDDLSSVKGLVAAVVLSVPVWAGVVYVAWKLLH